MTQVVLTPPHLADFSEVIFDALLESIETPVVIFSSNRTIDLVNSATLSAFGFTRQDLLNQDISVLVPTLFDGRPYDKVLAHPRNRNIYSINAGTTFAVNTKDTGTIEAQCAIHTVPLSTNLDCHLLLFNVPSEPADNSGLLSQIQKKLDNKESNLGQLINTLDGVVWEREAHGDKKFTFVSDQVQGLLGISADQLIEDPTFIRRHLHKDDCGLLREQFEQAEKTSQKFQVEYRVLLPKIGLRYFRNVTTPIKEDGRLVKLRGVLFDITRSKQLELEQKDLETQLARSQKLETVGRLAAGIAHEINTPAQFVGDNILFIQDGLKGLLNLNDQFNQLLKAVENNESVDARIAGIRSYSEEIDIDYLKEELPSAVQQSAEGVSRIAGIVKAMKEFAHPGMTDKECIDLNRAIETTLTVAKSEWREVARLETDFCTKLPLIECFASEINQALLNIIVNAAHAIDHKRKEESDNALGTIEITTSTEEGFAKITLKDSGGGIAAEHLENIFEPFFTTKKLGEGTGQGLSIAYTSIVDHHGGKLVVDSKVGEGTMFSIYLPLEGAVEASCDEGHSASRSK